MNVLQTAEPVVETVAQLSLWQMLAAYTASISSWIISLSVLIAALATIFKPVRMLLKKCYDKIIGEKDQSIKQDMIEIKNEIKDIKTEISTLKDGYSLMQTEMRENEKDRLRETIFKFGNYARHGSKITQEEMVHLTEMFNKYEKLGGNGSAKTEFLYTQDYYYTNSPDWVKGDV